VAAKALNAQWHVICAGGIGLLRNYWSRAASDPRTMPQVYLSLYPETASNTMMWDPKQNQWTPDVIMIGLGTNDFSVAADDDGGTRAPMTPGAFKVGLISFIATLEGYYPGVTVVIVSSPILGDMYPTPSDMQLTDDRGAVQAVTDYYADAGDSNVRVYAAMVNSVSGIGCGGHPNVAQQAAAATKTIVPVIKAAMNW
jgi:hypothetical protein